MSALSLSVNATEKKWLDYIKENVVGRLLGTSEEKAKTAALVSWWALKEGVLDLPNPWRHNLCAQGGGQGQIGDLEVCPGSAWQVGMSGIQPSAVTLANTEALARTLYGGDSIESILRRIAQDANVSSDVASQVESSEGHLRKAWLLRDPATSFELQRPFVQNCLYASAPTWCFGSWQSARQFASSRDRVSEVITSLEDFFSDAPSVGKKNLLPWLLALGAASVLLYGYSKENPRSKVAKALGI